MVNKIWTKIVKFSQTFGLFQHSSLVKISENISWLFFDKFLKILAGLFVGAWITRYLGPSQFGVYSYAVAFVALYTPLSGLGLANIVVRDIVKNPDQKDAILGTAFIMQLFAGLFAYGLSILVIILSKPDTVQMQVLVAILSGMLLLKAWNNTLIYWYQSQVQSKFNVWSRNIALIIIAAVRIGLILLNAPIYAFAIATIGEIVLVGLALAFFYLANDGRLTKWKFKLSIAKNMLNDSWPLIISGVAVIIYMKIDQIMLGNLTSVTQLGLYSAAVQLSELWYFIPVAIGSTFFPLIIKSRENRSGKEYNKRIQLFFDLMSGISYFIMVSVALLAPWVVRVLYGVDYAGTSAILSIHIWAFLFVSQGIARSRWLIAENMLKISMITTILGAVINVGVNILLIPQYAGLGAAWATVISYAISAFFSTLLFPQLRDLFLQQCLSLLMPFRLVSIWKSYQNILKEV